jgi:hypothetical protein
MRKGILQRYKENFAYVRLHWLMYPYFYKVVSLCMLGVGFFVFVCEYVLLPVNAVVVYTVLAPFGEELVKSSVFVLFLVSFVEYRQSGEQKSRVLVLDSLVLFVVLLVVVSSGEVLYPGNPLGGVDLVLLFVKKCGGHFALTVCGCLLFGLLYSSEMVKKRVVLVLGMSVGISMVLHSVVNQMGLDVFVGTVLLTYGVS